MRTVHRAIGQAELRAPIIVMGMHRSGTTLLAKMLEALGVYMGRGGGSNREAILFKQVNKWVFAQLGASSSRPDDAALASVSPELQVHLDRVLRQQVRGLGAARYLGPMTALRYRNLHRVDFPWGFKDPRNSFTAGLWKRVFPEAKILHIYRHPIDVASSLKKREEARLARSERSLRARLSEAFLLPKPLYCRYVRLLDMLEGVSLWEQYVEASFETCAPFEQDTMHCRYETLLERPRETLEELAEFIGVHPDASQLGRAVSQVDPLRGFAYRADPVLEALDAQIAHVSLLRKLDYRATPEAAPVFKPVSLRAGSGNRGAPTASRGGRRLAGG